jgi:hypothetical protein
MHEYSRGTEYDVVKTKITHLRTWRDMGNLWSTEESENFCRFKSVFAIILAFILVSQSMVLSPTLKLPDGKKYSTDENINCSVDLLGLEMIESFSFDSYVQGTSLLLGPEDHDFTLLAVWENISMSLWSTDGETMSLLYRDIYTLPEFNYSEWTDGKANISQLSDFTPNNWGLDVLFQLTQPIVIGVLGSDVIFSLGRDQLSVTEPTQYLHTELWKTDGTPGGTSAFFNSSTHDDWINKTYGGGGLTTGWDPVNSGGYLYFGTYKIHGNSGADPYLLRTDGTDTGTDWINITNYTNSILDGNEGTEDRIFLTNLISTNDAMIFKTEQLRSDGSGYTNHRWWAINESSEITRLYYPNATNLEFIETESALYVIKKNPSSEMRIFSSVYDLANNNSSWGSSMQGNWGGIWSTPIDQLSPSSHPILFHGKMYGLIEDNDGSIIMYKYGGVYDSDFDHLRPYNHTWNREYIANISEILEYSNWDFSIGNPQFFITPDGNSLLIGGFGFQEEQLFPWYGGCDLRDGTTTRNCTYLYTNEEKLNDYTNYLTNVSSLDYGSEEQSSLFNFIKIPPGVLDSRPYTFVNPEPDFSPYFAYYSNSSTPRILGKENSVHIRGNNFDSSISSNNWANTGGPAYNQLVVNGSLLAITYGWDLEARPDGWLGSRNITGEVYVNIVKIPDHDNDNICNFDDDDNDNDGWNNSEDDFPLDNTEWLDTDGDGIGNNADLDDDNDGRNDSEDDFPLDNNEWLDTDGDGIGNNADLDDDGDEWTDDTEFYCGSDSLLYTSLPDDNDGDHICDFEDIDDDNDGRNDSEDDFPLDNNEWLDTDGDGIGNNADEDDDNDRIEDFDDFCPIGETGWISGAALETDLDGDGCRDEGEDVDDDNDGINDIDDTCPRGHTGWISNPLNDLDADGCHVIEDFDIDGDGFSNLEDLFPEDPTEWYDSDGDGVGDNTDAFPLNSVETVDSDGDGVGDNADVFVEDPTEWYDSDGDGVGDNTDAFPDIKFYHSYVQIIIQLVLISLVLIIIFKLKRSSKTK